MGKQFFEFYDVIDDASGEALGNLFTTASLDMCVSDSPKLEKTKFRFACTRKENHAGFHVAHDTKGLACAIWRDADE